MTGVVFSDDGFRAMVRGEIRTRREWLKTWYGKQCRDYNETCPACQMWANQLEFERLVQAAIDQATEENES